MRCSSGIHANLLHSQIMSREYAQKKNQMRKQFHIHDANLSTSENSRNPQPVAGFEKCEKSQIRTAAVRRKRRAELQSQWNHVMAGLSSSQRPAPCVGTAALGCPNRAQLAPAPKAESWTLRLCSGRSREACPSPAIRGGQPRAAVPTPTGARSLESPSHAPKRCRSPVTSGHFQHPTKRAFQMLYFAHMGPLDPSRPCPSNLELRSSTHGR
jgi:hypothetical protein